MTVFEVEYTLLAVVVIYLTCKLLRGEKKYNGNEGKRPVLTPPGKRRAPGGVARTAQRERPGSTRSGHYQDE